MIDLNDEWHGTITRAIENAIKAAVTKNDQATFDFNGVTVIVDPSCANRDLIYRDWNRGINGYLGDNPTVGPIYKAELSAEELASDAAIETANEERRKVQREEMQRKDDEERAKVAALLESAGPIEITDQVGWDSYVAMNSKDEYSRGIIDYSIRWARLMQERITAGQSIEEIASETSQLADTDGITGFMYGAAVSGLAKFWKHGEQLRRWHNRDTQVGNEGDLANESGGVLNPALLSIDV